MQYRVHIALATTSATQRTELIARAKELGATHGDAGQDDARGTSMADPECNEFCVLGRS